MASRGRTILIWAIRVAAVVALVGCGLILKQSVDGADAAGCAPAVGCAPVLSSSWSRWFGVPVVIPGFFLYLAILLATGPAASAEQPLAKRLGWLALAVLAITAGGSGVWFIALQARMLGAVCLYCMAVHFCGFLIAILTAVALLRRHRDGAVLSAGEAGWTLLAAPLLLYATLIAGQLGSPQPSLFDLRKDHVDLAATDLPVLGSHRAAHALIVMSDYACEHCRELHPLITQVLRRYGPALAVLELPVPLNPQCNPAVAGMARSNIVTCDLARIALAVWRVRPEKFAEVHAWLLEPVLPRMPDEAREYAARVVGGAEVLERAEHDPWVSRTLRRTAEMYRQLGMGALPKIVLPHSLHHGAVDDPQGLFEAIEKEYGIKPMEAAWRPCFVQTKSYAFKAFLLYALSGME
jgi:uncharacterized membrane protein